MSNREPRLQTAAIEAVVEATPDVAFGAARAVAAATWGVGGSDIVSAAPPSLLVHAVRLDGEISCWLSWQITALSPTTSRVRLVHDEADLRPGPPPELEDVVSVLLAQLASPCPELPRQHPTDEVTP